MSKLLHFEPKCCQPATGSTPCQKTVLSTWTCHTQVRGNRVVSPVTQCTNLPVTQWYLNPMAISLRQLFLGLWKILRFYLSGNRSFLLKTRTGSFVLVCIRIALRFSTRDHDGDGFVLTTLVQPWTKFNGASYVLRRVRLKSPFAEAECCTDLSILSLDLDHPCINIIVPLYFIALNNTFIVISIHTRVSY